MNNWTMLYNYSNVYFNEWYRLADLLLIKYKEILIHVSFKKQIDFVFDKIEELKRECHAWQNTEKGMFQNIEVADYTYEYYKQKYMK